MTKSHRRKISLAAACALLLVGLVLAGARALEHARLARMRSGEHVSTAEGAAAGMRVRTAFEVAEPLYDANSGLKLGWKEAGAMATVKPGEPWRVSFAGFASIALEHAELPGEFGALVFRFKAPTELGEFLQVSLRHQAEDERSFPHVPVTQRQLAPLPDGWSEALIPFRALDPSGSEFDSVVIEARRMVPASLVELDGLVLTKPTPGDSARPHRVESAKVHVDCRAPATPISPLIYGIARGVLASGETAHRIGGNAMTRLNWDLGNVWNTGNDWFFENVRGDGPGLREWLETGRRYGLQMALTVPMIGWVAKDDASVGFPRSKYGKQRKFDPNRPQAGDGFDPGGVALRPGAPTQTSEPAAPERIKRWVEAIAVRDAEAHQRSVHLYMLDNEPDLWHRTHRDVHPEPLTYDELLEKTLAYGAAVRSADRQAVIAGPASWGWTGYFFSAKDQESGFHLQPDRRFHGNVPLIPWYLKQLAEHEQRTGQRILDVLDVHYYPQAPGVYGGAEATDAKGAALRIRSTRSLWDPTYRDESWIGESVELLPRLKRWVDANYPGRGIALGEWSFGGEEHVSGALATAEALGQFGRFGLKAAFYWSNPAAGTPTFWAFRAYRNYDGKGATFLDHALQTRSPDGVSAFASRNETGSRFVIVLLNLNADVSNSVTLELEGCGDLAPSRMFSYAGGPEGLLPVPTPSLAGLDSPAYSLQVLELNRGP